MKHFGSVRAMGNASVEDLAALEGMTHDAAEKVKEYIGRLE
jgi:excinuclease ABC subunit C